MGPRAELDGCGKSRLHRDSIPRPSSPSPVAIPTELPGPHIINSKYLPSFNFSNSVLVPVIGSPEKKKKEYSVFFGTQMSRGLRSHDRFALLLVHDSLLQNTTAYP